MDKRIMFNEDDTHFLFTRSGWENLGEKEIREFIRQYEGTGISDFLLCCAGQMSDFPSKVRECWLDKYDQKLENGIAVDYTEHPVVKCANYLWREKGLDFYAIAIDELRRIGIAPWLSVRMNDCHDNEEATSFLHPAFFYEHPEYRRVTHREAMEYFDRCLDYSHEEVRIRMLEYLEEVVMRYDADGLELDFQRELFCFKIGHEYEGIEIINEFLRQVWCILTRASEKWGHRVKLCVRTLATPQDALDSGYDVWTWAQEGLVDVVVPTPRWETTNADIPVELWKRLLAGTDVLLAPGIEILQKPTRKAPFHSTSIESVYALATQMLSLGADRIYLFNYMDVPDEKAKEDYGVARFWSPLADNHYMNMLNTLSSLDKLMQTERRHVVTYTDLGPAWYKVNENTLLPLTVQPGSDPRFVRVRVGQVPEDARVEVRLGTDAPADALKVYVNSNPCPYLRNETVVPDYTANEAKVYAVNLGGQQSPFMVVEMIAQNQAVTVDYVEIHVIPQA